MSAAFEFKRINVKKISFQKNDTDDREGNIKFSPSVQRSKGNKDDLKYNLHIMLSGPVTGELLLEGFFVSNNTIPAEEEDQAFLMIGFTILLPYARMIISTVSSFDGEKPITLPLINVNALFSEIPTVNESSRD